MGAWDALTVRKIEPFLQHFLIVNSIKFFLFPYKLFSFSIYTHQFIMPFYKI